MRKSHSINIKLLEMCTQFFKHCRKKDANVYRKIVCARHFISAQYVISYKTTRVFFVVENEDGSLSFMGTNVCVGFKKFNSSLNV